MTGKLWVGIICVFMLVIVSVFLISWFEKKE